MRPIFRCYVDNVKIPARDTLMNASFNAAM